jgi:thioredoxin-like negative regulator of GroEL
MNDSLDSLIHKANQLAVEKRYPECGEVFSKIFEISPGNPDVLRQLASVMIDLGHDEVALALLSDSINSDNPDVSTLHRMANLLRGLDRVDEAANLLICASVADPNNADLRNEVQVVLESLGREADFKDFFGEHPSNGGQ